MFCHSARNVLRKKTKEKEFIYLYNYLFINLINVDSGNLNTN